MAKVVASHNSIKRQIEDNIKNSFDAFNEYIWNSIDANATSVEITIEEGTDYIKRIEIVDNGEGINYEKLSDDLFGKFNTSLKSDQKEKNHSLPRGERGFGRFSFIKFSSKSNWSTVYHDKISGKNYAYTVEIEDYKLDDFNPSLKNESKLKTGTKVIFTPHVSNTKFLLNLKKKNHLQDLHDNICLEFAWIMELFGINIKLNGKKIDYSSFMQKPVLHIERIGDYDFNFKFIKWNCPLKNQSSRYYFLDSKGEEVFVHTTTMNDKSDEFFHSLYIQSEFFDNFDLMKTKYDETYRKLTEYFMNYLKKQRRPYLKNFSAKKFKEFEDKNLLPKFNDFETKAKKPIYEQVVKEVIEFAPSLASNSNDSQKKVLLELINRLLDDEQSRKILYSILEVLIDDDNKDQLQELDEKLRKYGLRNILGTIRIVEDRLATLRKLREMVYDAKHYFSESDLQKIIEQHFWIFGEEYNLMLCKEEDDFTKLRNRYYEEVLKIKKEEYEQYPISKRQVDLFISGVTSEGRKNKNLIVEIKTPDSYLIKSHYNQIDDYKDIILKTPELNSTDRNHWTFILMYRDISKEHEIFFSNEIKNKLTGLAKESENFKIFVVKWSDLIDEVEFRLRFIKDKLDNKKKDFIPLAETKVETKTDFISKFDNTAKMSEVKK